MFYLSIGVAIQHTTECKCQMTNLGGTTVQFCDGSVSGRLTVAGPIAENEIIDWFVRLKSTSRVRRAFILPRSSSKLEMGTAFWSFSFGLVVDFTSSDESGRSPNHICFRGTGIGGLCWTILGCIDVIASCPVVVIGFGGPIPGFSSLPRSPLVRWICCICSSKLIFSWKSIFYNWFS